MRGFAIGDTHLRAADRRDAQRVKSLEQILAAAVEETPDFIVWPGDLFDKTSTVADRQTLRRFMRSFADICPVIAVRGNHDVAGDLDIFGDLRASYQILFVTRPQVVQVHTRSGRLAIAALPYPEESVLVAAGVAPADIANVAAEALDVIFMALADGLADAKAKGWPTLFIGHANLVGAKASTGQPLTGAEIALRPEHLARLGHETPKILNHIHAPQVVHGAVYVGSIAAQDWGEREVKRYLSIEFMKSGGFVLTSRTLDTPGLYHVEGIATREGFRDWVVKDSADGAVGFTPASWAGQEVRVRFTFSPADAGLLNTAKSQIYATFAEAAHLELEPVAIVAREVRAPQVVAAKSMPEKLEAWTAAMGLPTSAGVQDKLAVLHSKDHTAVLAAIQLLIDASASMLDHAHAAPLASTVVSA